MATETASKNKKWNTQREEALQRFEASKQAYFERNGKDVEYQRAQQQMLEWLRQQDAATVASKTSWRENGDKQIISALEEKTVVFRSAENEQQYTRAYTDVVSAIINLCSKSCTLYAAASTIAKKSKRSIRTVMTVLKELESKKILIRLSSGGINERGEKQSNRYRLIHDELRKELGITQTVEANLTARACEKNLTVLLRCKPYWNDEGYRRHSTSARAMRRRELRARRGEVFQPVKNSVCNQVVIPLQITADQQFCTLTKQRSNKELNNQALHNINAVIEKLPENLRQKCDANLKDCIYKLLKNSTLNKSLMQAVISAYIHSHVFKQTGSAQISTSTTDQFENML